MSDPVVRPAEWKDAAALRELIAASVRELQREDYSEDEREGALGTVFGVDPALIDDGTYFLVEIDGTVCACGGWSRRATPFGTEHSPARDDRMLDPERDAAKIRALFVHPAYARRGLGSLILERCESAAREAGFRTAELTATRTGEKLFRTRGYEAHEEVAVELANGEVMRVTRMRKTLG